MVTTHIKKYKHSMLCVTGVYFRDITNMIFCNFTLECESSEQLALLVYFLFHLFLSVCVCVCVCMCVPILGMQQLS